MVTLKGKIKLKFGVPEHGWLSLNLKCEDYELVLDISDFPNNPVDDLRSAIMILSQSKFNGTQEIPLNLEPVYYYFLITTQNDNLNIVISHSDNSGKGKQIVQSINGTYSEILMPIYRALMDFYSFNYKEPHWPKTEGKLIEKLKDSIKKST